MCRATHQTRAYITLNVVLLALIGCVCVAAPFLSVKESGLCFLDVALPRACAFNLLMGHACPGCGAMRSTVLAMQGRWAESWAMHPVGLGLAGYLVLQGAARLWLLAMGKVGERTRRLDLVVSALGLLAVLTAGLVLRLLIGPAGPGH